MARLLHPVPVRNSLVEDTRLPVPITSEFRSAEIAVPVRIRGARIAVRVRAVSARRQRVFQFLALIIRDLLHALKNGAWSPSCPTRDLSNSTTKVSPAS